MKSYVVLGLGRFGKSIATSLYNLGKEVLAVDKSEDNIEEIQDNVTHAIIGECSDEHVLKSIGVRNFDIAIVATGDDMQSTTLTTILLKEMGAKYIIARALSDIHARILTKVGADRVIMPEHDMGVRLAKTIASANLLEYIDLSDDYSIAEITAPVMWVNKSIGELRLRSEYNVSVLAIKQESGMTISPMADFVISKGDLIFIIGHNDAIDKLKE